MTNKKQDLTQGPVGTHLTRLTMPMFLGISSMIVASMVDAIYIGILGAEELAAYSFTYPLVMALFSLSMGMGNGASSIIARAQGKGDRYKVKLFTTHALLLTIILGLCLTFVTWHFQSRIFTLMGAEGEVHAIVVGFFNIWILGLILYTLPMVVSTLLRSVGNARIPGYIMTSTSALQMVLAPIMIFGLLGMPEMGLLGSVWAAILSGIVRTFAMLWVLVVSEKLLLTGVQVIKGLWESTNAILYIGLPSMLSNLIGPFSMGVIIWLLAEHGPSVVAGFGITSRIEMLMTMILMSLSSSIGPFVGQNWGARKVDRIYLALSKSDWFCLFWGVFCFVLLAPFGEFWISLINEDAELVSSAAWYLLLVPITYSLLGIGMTSSSVFVALGKPLPGLVLSVMRMIIVYIPLAMLFNFYWGYIGVFVATGIANCVMGVLSYVWCRRTIRTSISRLSYPR